MSGVIVGRRLRTQGLLSAPFATPEEVVGWLGAAQAQDFGPAKWAVGERASGATDALLDRAFAAGTILRTHVLRPTWHFVLPADIRWLLTATAPRVRARNAHRERQLGLDDDILRRSARLLERALHGGEQLTRREAAAVLSAAGLPVEGQRLAYLLMNAELDAVICSGPRRGSQHTYVLLEERAPDARELPRDEALAELARRYFTSHGPATAKDFAGWASLTLTEVGEGLEAAGPALRREELGGATLWSGADHARRSPAPTSPSVRLVQGYDEYIMGYSETRHVLARPGSSWTVAAPPVFGLVILLDGRVAGTWKRVLKKDGAVVRASLFEPFGERQLEALADEAARYGQFLGLSAGVELV